MVANILNSITASIGRISSENRQFRQIASQQNTSISKFIRDISKMFSSQGKQQSDINSSLNDLQQTTAGTGQKVDQTNSLLQESISIQTQMLNQLKNVSSGITNLLQSIGVTGGADEGGAGAAFSKFAGGALLGAGLTGAAGTMMGGLPGITNMFGGGSASGVSGAGSSEYANEAMKFFQSKGWTTEQAAGIVGNLQAESGKDLNPYLPGDGGKAFGIAQWHPDRQAKFNNQFGKPLSKSTFQEQLEFVQWELENDERKAAELLRQAKTAAQAAVIVDKYYERSAGLHTDRRIANAEALSQQESSSEKQTTPEGDGDFIKQSSPVNLQKYNLKDPSHVDGLDKSFQNSLGKFLNAAQEAGHSIKIYSGYRSPERQKELFRNAVMKYGSPEAARKWVAPPGRSKHNYGAAADLKYETEGARQWAHQNASKYGLNFRMGHEPWHIEPANANSIIPSSTENSLTSNNSGVEGGNVFSNMVSGFSDFTAGTPFASMTGIFSGISSALDTMMGGLPNILGHFGGGQAMGPMASNSEIPENEGLSTTQTANATQVNSPSNVPLENPRNDSDYIQSAALSNESLAYNSMAAKQTPPIQNNINDSQQPNQDLYRGGMASTSSQSSTTSWYLQLAGRVVNDETMKFKGGVFV